MRWDCGRVAIAVRHNSVTALEAARRIVRVVKELGWTPVNPDFNGLPSSELGVDEEPLPPDRLGACRFVVVGGDGTLLRTIRHIPSVRGIIFMTVGAGRRCFYFDIDTNEAEEYVRRFLRNDFAVQHYMLGRVLTPNIDRAFLNEVVLAGDRAKLARLEVYVGTQKVYDVFGDGLIIATASGSTAYSLSAGGPVLEPLLRGFVVTPLVPIQLSNRPVVTSPFARIKVFVRKDGVRPRLIVDGFDAGLLEGGTELFVRAYEWPLVVARFNWVRFYERTFERPTLY